MPLPSRTQKQTKFPPKIPTAKKISQTLSYSNNIFDRNTTKVHNFIITLAISQRYIVLKGFCLESSIEKPLSAAALEGINLHIAPHDGISCSTLSKTKPILPISQ